MSPDPADASEAAFRQYEVESWTLTSLAVFICALRTYARAWSIGVRRFCVDDYLVWVGVVRHVKNSSHADVYFSPLTNSLAVRHAT